MRSASLIAFAVCLASISPWLPAIDKNGVAPQAISLPSGPGSIQGLGESFQPQLNTASGSTGVKLLLPRGPGGLTPGLSLAYNSGAPNGAFGLGWSLTGMFSIRRNTDHGVPFYTDGPDGLDNDADGTSDNPGELDSFSGLNGEELVALADGSFRAENEAAFFRYTRTGAGWEARGKDGRRYQLGLTPQARVEDAGRVFEWCLESLSDPNGNAITCEYLTDPAAPAMKYLRRVRWGTATSYLAAVLSYEEGRPDEFTSYRSGFELRTRLRLRQLDVISHGLSAPAAALRADLDGEPGGDALVRRYRFEYQPGAHLSLLTRVTQLGFDGVTALPTLSYEYTAWTPPDDVSATVIRSRDAPTAAFESPSVELIDMNADALPDLLTTAGSQHRVFLNRGIDAQGRLAWAPSEPVGEAPPIDISSDRTHLADATSDGLSDLMVKVSNTSFLCFDNTSRNAWTANPFPIQNTDTWPIWPHDGAAGAQSRSFDSDYSRSNDVLHTTLSGNQLWLLLPGGRYSRELRFPPLVLDGQTFRFDLPGTHIADLNGDRLQDLAWIQGTRVVYFPNRGRGDFAAPVVLDLGRTLAAADIERADFSDVDGDGLVDLTVVRPSFQPGDVVYWLNRFQKGLEGPRSVGGLPAQRAGDALRWADMNGNGTTDIAISQAQSAPGEKVLVVDLVPEGKNFLLRRADNGLGRRIAMDYESSTSQMVRAEAAGRPWGTRMPVAVTVVGRIAEEDGLSPPYEQTISYRDPYYDPAKQEFRGFRGAEAHEAGDGSAAAKVGRFVFDTGEEVPCLKGKQLSEEVLGEDGTLFTRTLTTWRPRVLAQGIDGREVCFALSEAQDQFVHEGEAEGIRIRSETDYDDYGNAVAERRLGVFAEAGDEIIVEREYELRLGDWRLDLLVRETTLDGAGNRAAEKRQFYDARGNLERTESWLDTEDRFVPVLRQRFDAFGNVVEKTDARGNRRSLGYDLLLHAWPTSETVHLAERDLAMTAEYDLGLGVVTTAVDFSAQRRDYEYDPLGRLIEVRDPGGAGESYEYQPGNPVSRIIKRVREDLVGGTFDSYTYSDGHSRPLGSKVEGEDGPWRFLEAKTYNSRKLEARSWLPHLSDTPEYTPPESSAAHQATKYDPAGRPTEVLEADGSREVTEYRPLASAAYDGNDLEGGGGPDLRRTDGLGRMVVVEEQNGADAYKTTYAWNARGELETIVDALGNTRRFRFDSLGRFIEVNDPDRGRRRYTMDDAGNLSSRTDAKGRITTYVHDAANRIVEKDYAGVPADGAQLIESIYHYDSPAGSIDFGDGTSGAARNVLGRLAWVEDTTGEEHFSYDARGNVEWIVKRVRHPGSGLLISYRTQHLYDAMNREVETIFPDNDRLLRRHGAGSFVNSIGGGPGGRTILQGALYAASGQPLLLQLGSDLETLFAYDARQRLQRLRVVDASGREILHETLGYDQAFNIVAVDDVRPAAQVPLSSPLRRTARYRYDELHRLTQALYGVDGENGRIDYEYDAIGNLLRQSTPGAGMPGHIPEPAVSLGAVSYAGGRTNRVGRGPADPPGPHALTGTSSGHRLSYDADGNVTALDEARLDWDPEDLLASYQGPGIEARYLHDHAERRIVKHLTRGSIRSETIYVDPAFEVIDGSPVKYVMLGDRRLAKVQGRLDPARDAVQRLALAPGWNLVAAAVETTQRLGDVFGSDADFYEARGESYAPVEATSSFAVGRPVWVHAPSSRVATLRGPAAAAAAPASTPGPLHAWPHAVPFRPADHLIGSPRIHVYDAAARRWHLRDSALPDFLSAAPPELGVAQAFWSAGAVTFTTEAPEPQGVTYYHLDAVGSTAALTDADGQVVEARTHFPYGAARGVERSGGPSGGTDHDFTGKERDRESGLTALGARAYFDAAGSFLSPDPRFVEVAKLAAGSEADKKSFTGFLANPQMGNHYAYGLRNPLKYIDSDGLEVYIAGSLRDDPVFQKSWKLFLSTREGQRIFKELQKSEYKIYVVKGDLSGMPTRKGRYAEGATTSPNDKGEIFIQVDMDAHKSHPGVGILGERRMRKQLANTIDHEFVHADIFARADVFQRIASDYSKRGDEDFAKAYSGKANEMMDLHKVLDAGEEPSNVQFQREVGLRK